MDLRTLRWKERVAFIKGIYETANSSKYITHYEVAEQHGVPVGLVNRLLRGHVWKAEIRSARVHYLYKRSSRGPRPRSLLTFLEIESAVTSVNLSKTLEEALELNPYHPVREHNPYVWISLVIRMLWDLKLRKRSILKGTGGDPC